MGRVCVCKVWFCDRQSIERSAEVQAASVYEAACRAWAIFKSSEETFEESFKAKEFVVEVRDEPRTFHVNLEKLLEWLDRGRRGLKDTPRKKHLRTLLDANLPP
jgi:hypothetical protein